MNQRNRIILLIDFSKYSENLTDFAFKISEIIDAKVIFVHRLAGIAPGMADQTSRDEIIKAESDEAHSNLRKLAKGRVYSDDAFQISQKPVLSILKSLASEFYFDWVFAGLKGTGILKRLFIGSTTLSIVNDSDLLTVALPMQKQLSVPSKLMVGVNPDFPLNKDQFSKVLSAMKTQIKQLEFFSILKKVEEETKTEAYLTGLQVEYKVHEPTIQLYKEVNAFDMLKQRVELTENSFLVLQQGSRSLSETVFRKFMINELVYSGKIPLIVLSS